VSSMTSRSSPPEPPYGGKFTPFVIRLPRLPPGVFFHPAREGAAKEMALTQPDLPGTGWYLRMEASGPRFIIFRLGAIPHRTSRDGKRCARRARRAGAVQYLAVYSNGESEALVGVTISPWASAEDARLAFREAPPQVWETRTHLRLDRRTDIGDVFPGAEDFFLAETVVSNGQGPPWVVRVAGGLVEHVTFAVTYRRPPSGASWEDVGLLAVRQRDKLQRTLDERPHAGLGER
jgi:hypothetical protein